MSDKFLGYGQGSTNLTNGSATIFASTLGASALDPSKPLKTNSVRQLVSTDLNISDVVNLDTELNEKVELQFVKDDTHTPADVGNMKIYFKTDGLIYKKDEAGVETAINGSSVGLQEAYENSGTNAGDAKIDIDNTRFGVGYINNTGTKSNTLLYVSDPSGSQIQMDGFGNVKQLRGAGTDNITTQYGQGVTPYYKTGLLANSDDYHILNENTGNSALKVIRTDDKVKITNTNFTDNDELVNKGYVDTEIATVDSNIQTELDTKPDIDSDQLITYASTLVPLAGGVNTLSITSDGTNYLATSTSGEIVQSGDGVNWSPVPPANYNNTGIWNDAVYAGGYWLITDDNNKNISYSASVIGSYTDVPITGNGNPASIAYSGSVWVCTTLFSGTSNNIYYTSNPTTTWSVTSAPNVVSTNWHKVTWSSDFNKFVASSRTGNTIPVMVSTDATATSWVFANGIASTGVNIADVACGNGLMVAMRTSGQQVYISSDGLNFTQSSTVGIPVGGVGKTMKYLNGKFTVSQSNIVYVSTDGINWTLLYTQSGVGADYVYNVDTYYSPTSNAILRATFSTGTPYISANTPVGSTQMDVGTALAPFQNMFMDGQLRLSNGGSTTDVKPTSVLSNKITAVQTFELGDVVTNGYTIPVVQGSSNQVLTADGANSSSWTYKIDDTGTTNTDLWTADKNITELKTKPDIDGTTPFNQSSVSLSLASFAVQSIDTDGTNYVATSNSSGGQIVSSSDGINWTNITSPQNPGGTWIDVKYGGGYWVIGNFAGGIAYSTSHTGPWTKVAQPVGGAVKSRALAFSGTTWVCTTNDATSNNIFYTTNPTTTWNMTSQPVATFSGAWQSVDWSSDFNKFVASTNIAGANVGIMISNSSGSVWSTPVGVPTNKAWRGVACGNGRIVAITQNGVEVTVSTDGTNFTSYVTAGTVLPTNIFYLKFENNQFIFTTSNNNVYVSDDGINWSILYNQSGIASNNGTPSITYNSTTSTYVATGNNLLLTNNTGNSLYVSPIDPDTSETLDIGASSTEFRDMHLSGEIYAKTVRQDTGQDTFGSIALTTAETFVSDIATNYIIVKPNTNPPLSVTFGNVSVLTGLDFGFSVSQSGYYEIHGIVSIYTDDDGQLIRLHFAKNGVKLDGYSTTVIKTKTRYIPMSCHAIIQLNAGDNIQLLFNETSGNGWVYWERPTMTIKRLHTNQ